ncbi:hypothetical protein LC76P1_00045 [Lysinibacillus phage LC76P1]|nr:hypothetical protein LC76P1_00045 [Lysinibacillus phage LC76P1]
MLKVHFKLMAEGFYSVTRGTTTRLVESFSMYPSDEQIENAIKQFISKQDDFTVIDFYVKKAYSLEDEV